MLEQAVKIKRKYRRILNKLNIKTRHGDKQACIDIIKEMTNYNVALHAVGYRETDENEPGRVGRLVPITEEWRAKQIKVTDMFDEYEKNPTLESFQAMLALLKNG